ncbi:MAG: hypothetical protein LAO56_15210 [Acidobacteriia bacterium]|nr:hypothetical protein [Terriglobia bacterium]
MCWAQTTGTAAHKPGNSDATKQKKENKQTPVGQLKAQPRPKSNITDSKKGPKPDPAEPDNPGDASPGAPNDTNMGVRELDISCPAAQYKLEDGQRTCADPGYAAFNNAKEIAHNLDQVIAGLHVRAIDDQRLLISWNGKRPEHALHELERLIQQQATRAATADPDENRLIRLYNNRNAAKVAEAIKGLFEGVDATAVGDDVIFLNGKGDPSKRPFSNIDRMVARMDLPRPQVTLNVWSLQMSSKDPKKLNDDAKMVQEQVRNFDTDLGEVLRSGWKGLVEDWAEERSAKLAPGAQPTPEQKSGQAFRDYVARISLGCGEMDIPTCKRNSKIHLDEAQICPNGHYCLGFIDAFDLTTPSLTRMLLLLAAADSPKTMSARALSKMRTTPGNCPPGRQTEGKPVLLFCNFQAELNRLEGPRLGALRAAYADFLFNYKWATSYPNDFVPYELSLSASILDSQLDPFLTALNRDISEYLQNVQDSVQHDLNENKGNKKDQFYSTGVVSVRAISGLSAEVDTRTANFFDATPPLTINDIAKSLKDVESSMPASVKANLGANAAAALMAGLTAEKPAVAKVGRSLTLKVTPVSLITASAAELEVMLDANEDGEDQVIFKDQNKTTQVDDTSRVAQHKVSTHVRVESMKLFELSSFSASLRRKNRSFPLLPPFVELPYLGSLVRLTLPADPTFHRSFAIASAIVVPTAADLAFGIPFMGDRKVVPVLMSEAQPVDRCIYEPAPAQNLPPNRTAQPGPKTHPSGASETGPVPQGIASDSGKAVSMKVQDLCESQPSGMSTAVQNAAVVPDKYVVRKVGSASELSHSVRPYHKKIVDCFKNWNSGCETLSLSEVESEER